MHDAIRTALTALDPSKPEDWTKGGLPSLEAVRELVGPDVTRDQIAAAAPGFTRERPVFDEDVAAPTPAPAPAPADAPSVTPEPPAAEPSAPIEPAAEPSPIEVLRERHAELELARRAASAAIEAAKAHLYRVEKSLANLQLEIDKLTPKLTPAQEYNLVVQRSIERRYALAAQAQQPTTRSPRSRLDQRLSSRRRQRGARA